MACEKVSCDLGWSMVFHGGLGFLHKLIMAKHDLFKADNAHIQISAKKKAFYLKQCMEAIYCSIPCK